MPNAADPRLTGGVQLPLTHNPLQRINYQTPNPILDPAAIAAAEEAAIEAFLQLLKTTTGIDLTGFWESLQQASANAQTALQQLSAIIQGIFGAAGTPFDFTAWLQQVETNASNAWNELEAFFATGDWDDLTAAFDDLFGISYTANNNATAALQQWSALIQGILGGGGTPFDLATFLNNTWTQLTNTWNDFWNGIFGTSATGKTSADVLTAAGSVSSTANTASTNATSALSQWTAAITAAGQATATAFGTFVSNTWSNLTTTWNSIWNGTYGTSATGKTASDVQTATAATSSTANTASTNASSALSQWAAALTAAGQATATALGTFVTNTWTQLGTTWNSIWNGTYGTSATGKTATDVQTAAGSVSSTANTASTNATSALSQFTSMLTAAGQATATAVGTALSTAVTNLQSTWNAFWNGTYGTSVTGKTASDVQTAAAATASTANTAGTNASTALTSASAAVSQWTSYITGLGGAVVSDAVTYVTNTFTQLSNTWNSFWNGTYGTSATGKTASDVQTAAAATASTANTAGTNASTALSTASSASSTATTASTDASTAITNAAAAATSASTAQSTAQGAIDAGVQALTGGAGTGNSPAALGAVLGAQPSSTILPTPNPSAGGVPIHGASGSWTPAAGSLAVTSLTASGSHTKATADNYCVFPALYITASVSASDPTPYLTRVANYGANSLSSLTGPIPIGNLLSSGVYYYAYLEYFGGNFLAPGAQTVSVEVGNIPGWTFGIEAVIVSSDSYSGVTSLGFTNIKGSATGAPSESITSTTTSVVVQAFAAISTAAITLSAYTKTQRSNSGSITAGALRAVLLAGDSAGTATTTFGATETTTGGASYSAAAISLVGNGPAPIGSGFRAYRTSTALSGVSTGSAVLAGFYGVLDTANSTSDYSYNTTTSVLTIANAGWYMVKINLLTSSYTSVNLGTALYQNGALYEYGGYAAPTSGAILSDVFIVYCNAGDTLSPAYQAATTFSSTFTGEATGKKSYFEVSLLNRSLL